MFALWFCASVVFISHLVFVDFVLCVAFASLRFFADVSLVYLCGSLGSSFMACGLFVFKKKKLHAVFVGLCFFVLNRLITQH